MAQNAFAHTRSQSFSNWNIEGEEAQFVFTVDARRITQIGSLYPEITELPELLRLHVEETLSADQGGEVCDLKELRTIGNQGSNYRVAGRVICESALLGAPPKLTLSAFFAVSPTHIHIARVNTETGAQDYILREGQESFRLDPSGAPQSIWGFILAGFHHVLSGLDHIVFLIGLALVARRPKQAVLCVTGFTLGHMCVLALSSYGLISPDVRAIEAMIGFTIALMALESGAELGLSRRKSFLSFAALTLVIALVPLSGQSALMLGLCLAVYTASSGQISQALAMRALPAISIAFGLIHGAGFAGALKPIAQDQSNILLPLAGFNIGVELAQLLCLVIAYAVFWLLGRSGEGVTLRSKQLTCLLIFGLGCFWFAQRLWV